MNSGSMSSSTSTGDFPPSSRDVRFIVFAASTPIFRPTSVEPVKVILSTPLWRTSAAPVVSPKPVITLTTPGGKPASSISSASRSAVSGVCSAGFTTTVQPAASAGASFHIAIRCGKFHGMIAATTPTGSRRV